MFINVNKERSFFSCFKRVASNYVKYKWGISLNKLNKIFKLHVKNSKRKIFSK